MTIYIVLRNNVVHSHDMYLFTYLIHNNVHMYKQHDQYIPLPLSLHFTYTYHTTILTPNVNTPRITFIIRDFLDTSQNSKNRKQYFY